MKVMRILFILIGINYLFVQNLKSQQNSEITAQHFPESGLGNVVNVVFSSNNGVFKNIHMQHREKRASVASAVASASLKVKVKGKSLQLFNAKGHLIKDEPLPYYVTKTKDTQAILTDGTVAVSNLQKTENPENFEILLEHVNGTKE